MCRFPLHTTITIQQVHSLPLQTTRKFSLYFVNKLCWNHTDLGIRGSMAPSHFAETTQQSPPSIRQAYVTLYITGSFHTLHSVYFEFPHADTNLSIGGSMAEPSTTLTLFVLSQTQQSWSQSTHKLTHTTGHPSRLTYNLSPIPSQVPHLGWGGTWWDTSQLQI